MISGTTNQLYNVWVNSPSDVFAVDGDLVNRNGYRIIQGLEEVAKIIHPELFE